MRNFFLPLRLSRTTAQSAAHFGNQIEWKHHWAVMGTALQANQCREGVVIAQKEKWLIALFAQNYIVYWTENPDARLCEWQKMTVYGPRVVFTDLKYDWFYLFCAVIATYFFYLNSYEFSAL